MLLMSQNGKRVVDMTGLCVAIGACSQTIVAYSMSELDDDCYVLLGEYGSEEQAKEVLREILQASGLNFFYMP